ncbi:MAG TPA: choice-of-anchor I family protein [Chitinophagaceae bacterium]|nr:choice-of-anchor I family protein [Chitinophagaceae bacterium]
MKQFKNLVPILFLFLFQNSFAQTTFVEWNFNSTPPDGSNSTGSTLPSVGAGTFTTIGGITQSFSSGSANGGSSDPALTDNTGLQTTTFAAQGTNNNSCGIQFQASTLGYQNIILNYDLRHSNTSSRYEQVQYTLDITATTPVWVDATTFDGNVGDTWFKNRTIDLSAVTSLNNNPNAAFRVVSTFGPSTSVYAATGASSSYASSGTWRFDMVEVKGQSFGADIIPPIAQTYLYSNATNSIVVFSEPVSSLTATNILNYNFTPALSISNISLSANGDTAYIQHSAFIDGTPYAIQISGVQDIAGNTMAATSFNTIFNGLTPNLVITEIIHSPNDIEMIEVYNASGSPIPLGGLFWAIGTTGAFPVITLPADSTIVFATSTATASTSLNVANVYTILNGLGSSNDNLVIRNSLNQTVDSVQYFVGINGWPIAPSSVYGYSFELNYAASDNSVGTNWNVPVNQVTPQPTQGIILGTPGKYPAPIVSNPNPTIVLTGNKLNTNESAGTVSVTATLNNGNFFSSAVEVSILAMSTATQSSDYTVVNSLNLIWPALSNGVSQTIQFSIQDDLLPEDAEYIILRLTNPTNATLSSANYYTIVINDNDKLADIASESIKLNYVTSFSNGAAGVNSAEIVAYDALSKRLFIANSIGAKLDIVNFANPSNPILISSLSMATYGNINSVAVKNGIVAVAIENIAPQSNGKVVFFDTNGNYLNEVVVGAMPDMITFNNSGTKVITPNEGEPNTAYTIDPLGTISIIDISGGVASLNASNVTTLDFTAYNSQLSSLKAAGVRIFGLGASVAQDMEPEYITLSDDDSKAWVVCQENNALVEINLLTNSITSILPLGSKDFSLTGNALDANDQGGIIQMATWPIKGFYMPDAIASYTVAGTTYVITANEGDAREYNGYSEVARMSSSSYVLDPTVFPNADVIKANIGRLNITTANGDTDNDGDFDEIYTYGSRSITIWNATTGTKVWDSGDDFELITSQHPQISAIFNASNANNTFKNRSDDKGPEPEGVTIAYIYDKVYAFISLERIGGCMVYDVTNPANPIYVDYKNSRNLVTYGGDNGAEGIIYIKNSETDNGKSYVILANEVSSTLSIYEVEVTNIPYTTLDITAILEGYYAGSQTMQAVKFNQGVSMDTTICDDVSVELYTTTNISSNTPGPYTPDYTFNAVANIQGEIISQFPSSILGNTYWMAIKHRNHIKTWSANPITISEYTNYNFSNAATKAYGANQKEVSIGTWAFYSGDINQDENIDLLDLGILEADINNFIFGYYPTDINGDGNVDLLDAALVETNVNAFVFSIHP